MTTITLETVKQRVTTGYCLPDVARLADGADYGNKCEEITIGVNNVWGGRAKDGGCISSYEKVGYHCGSVEFIEGVLSTDCPVYVYCDGPDGKVERRRLVRS